MTPLIRAVNDLLANETLTAAHRDLVERVATLSASLEDRSAQTARDLASHEARLAAAPANVI